MRSGSFALTGAPARGAPEASASDSHGGASASLSARVPSSGAVVSTTSFAMARGGWDPTIV